MVFDVRRLDVYRKIPKDLTQPTLTGGIVSICCCLFLLFLFLSEFIAFINLDVTSELFVDHPGSEKERILVRINISLPRLPCDVVGLDIQDDMGRHEVGFVENTEKMPLFDGKGCRFQGKFQINKCPGNFHVSTHSASIQPQSIDMAHFLHEVSFGQEVHTNQPGSYNPLLNIDKLEVNSMESHDYIVKLVPTIFEDLSGNRKQSYQYTYAYKKYVSIGMTGRVIPAIWFRYDLTPITVKYTEKRQPIYSFLTTICAIIGGTFTVAGIIDSTIFRATEIFKKFELGKLS